MEISMLDIYRGFVRNYYGLRLEYLDQEFTDTKYTNVILNYFLRAGECMGFDTGLEKDRCDLYWRKVGSSKNFVHFEHENQPDLDVVMKEEYKKLEQSSADCVIGLFYPFKKKDVDDWISKLSAAVKWKKEVLFILTPLLHNDDREIELHALMRNDDNMKHYVSKMPYLEEPTDSVL